MPYILFSFPCVSFVRGLKLIDNVTTGMKIVDGARARLGKARIFQRARHESTLDIREEGVFRHRGGFFLKGLLGWLYYVHALSRTETCFRAILGDDT